ncbi:hypothetical protein Pst134EB_012969 [Puccinia striiformis f. sp. tritici]|nr:hypothetical protein Pst134EB_012969 [Puccinia striiformis f. sp. tritici]
MHTLHKQRPDDLCKSIEAATSSPAEFSFRPCFPLQHTHNTHLIIPYVEGGDLNELSLTNLYAQTSSPSTELSHTFRPSTISTALRIRIP